ncbi:hypothetical protein CO058_02165 [candidate division WWE3 bacterium CG_4_9_14_0_2_um_filter_35_11]|uniref:HTH cro/C1-type domain-containing protein n=1 Tax=candidate division WWE3 bacterium CG_4_9_14_0_2_um_filter_35_11 TaxID=1975077 RepID=A0A2M8ELR1_UNCKA|nr:MAG: hypothetical protein COV25_00555 [candidate division WWE3 bacterium CG10_big_fil_rev_8_21_14_0_10_35_32]PJC23655.1 MAG: hypothetical protein CO058_02165 [candidate division WWE3 bacterium CG_4_9_14_0_2_um_filter_35_11]
MSTTLLARKIKEARLEANLSQIELSKALVVNEKSVSSYEAGRTKPNIETLNKIAKKTNKPLAYFTDDRNVEIDLDIKMNNIQAELEKIKEILKNRREK